MPKYKKRSTKKKTWPLLLLLLALPVILAVAFMTQDLRQRASGATNRPNIIVIQTDDQRFDSMQYMPMVRNRLGNSGVTFTNHYVTTSICCPSRAGFLTGQFTHNHKTWWNIPPYGGAHKFKADNERSTIAVWLQAAGYRTSLIGKYLNAYGHPTLPAYIPPGWSDWHVFSHKPGFYDYKLYENGKEVAYGAAEADYSTDVLKRKATNFVKFSKEPFFLYFAPYAPHSPAIPAKRHEGMCDTMPLPTPPSFNEADVSDKPEWIRNQSVLPQSGKDAEDNRYLGWVENHRKKQICSLKAVDEAVRDITVALGPRMNNTLIIFTSDNGDMYGEHRLLSKNCIYDECIHTPLIIKYPTNTTAKTTDALVQNIDVTATILDYAGVPIPSSVDGKSLRPVLTGQQTDFRDAILSEHLNSSVYPNAQYDRVIRTKDWKYAVLGFTSDPRGYAEEELYDLKADPYELNNLARKGPYQAVKLELMNRLRELRAYPRPTKVNAPEPTPESTVNTTSADFSEIADE